LSSILKERTQEEGGIHVLHDPQAGMLHGQLFATDLNGRMFMSWYRYAIKPDKPVLMIACDDLRFFGAQALLHPENLEYQE